MAPRYDSVSFLTDWGLVDEFVGVVKSVIRDLSPHAVVTDLTHMIRPFDVRGASLSLARAMPYLPSGVVLAVVDPGVGTNRRALAIEVADGAGVLVGPDNGLLAPAVSIAGGAGRCVQLTNTDFHLDAPGATFAGRDVFAPCVAQLCNGVDLAELGDEIDPEELLPGTIPLPRVEDGALLTEVLWVDRYGNCQLNIGPDDLAEVLPDDAGLDAVLRLTIGEDVRSAALRSNYASAGGIALVPDSTGMLALVANRRSAAEELRLGTGDQVAVSVGDSPPPRTTGITLRPRRP